MVLAGLITSLRSYNRREEELKESVSFFLFFFFVVLTSWDWNTCSGAAVKSVPVVIDHNKLSLEVLLLYFSLEETEKAILVRFAISTTSPRLDE